MPEPFAQTPPVDAIICGKTVEELLLLVADSDQGLKANALERLMSMEFEELYPVLETGVRNDGNADLRNGSMEVLVTFGKLSVPRLIKLLRDDNEEIRNFAAVMLGDIGNREAVGALIQALGDNDINVSHGAAEALGKIGDRSALLPLIELLKGDFWLQYAAITAIGAMRDYRAVPHLLSLLENDLLAEPVIQTLGEIGDPRALYPLCSMLATADDALAGKVAKALVAIYRHINEAFKYKNSLTEFSQPGQLKLLIKNEAISSLRSLLANSGDSATVEAAITLLGWVGDSASLDYFFTLLENENYLASIESAILSLGDAAAKTLIAALDHENDTVRIVAIRSLRWLGKSEVNTVLADLLTYPNAAVQIEALETLKICPTEAILPVLYRFLQHENQAISILAAEALGNFPLSRIQQFIDSLASSCKKADRKCAATLLCFLHNCGSAELLSVLVADQEPDVRREALNAVGIQQVKAALPLLQQALADQDATVREAAVMALAEFGEPNYTEDLLALLEEGDEQLDYAVIRAIGMMGATATGSALMEYLQEGKLPRNLEFALIETLGKITCISASALISDRYLQHPDPDIRRLAIETLGKLGDPHSLKGVENAIQDPHWSVRVAALHVLGRVGGAKELPLLLAAMEDKDYLVKKNAILALGNVQDISTVPALAHQLMDVEMSRYAFEALLKYGKMALPWLHRLMTRNFPIELRVRVIDLIGKIADHKSVEPLLVALDDSSPEVRLAAIDSLAFCFDSLPLKMLASIKMNDRNDEVKERAELALKTFLMEKCF